MNPIVPVILILTLLLGGGAFYFLEVDKSKKKSINKESANELINVKDIRDKFLYTNDNLIMTYFKIQPISIDLLSDREKRVLTKNLTAELSSEHRPFKFMGVSRPIDISPLLSEYTQLMTYATDRTQKTLLRNEILVMSEYAMSGEVVERQFYICLWEKYQEDAEKELTARVNEMIIKFEGAGIRCEVLFDQDIVRLCNLVNNPTYIHMENTSIEATIPILIN